jgi:HTH-type transcriptional regulator/antitoxin HigA
MRYKVSTSNSSLRTANTTATRGKGVAKQLDRDRYGVLLAKTQPTFPRTVKESRRLTKILRSLTDKGSARTPEETELARLLASLIASFEQQRYRPERSRSNDLLLYLMEEHHLRQRDLLDIFPTRSRISEVLSGKRAITKEQAVLLGKRFAVSPVVFLGLAS